MVTQPGIRKMCDGPAVSTDKVPLPNDCTVDLRDKAPSLEMLSLCASLNEVW